MTGDSIYELLLAKGISSRAITVLDDDYRLPARSVIVEDFAKAFDDLKSFLGTRKYIKNARDCDKFAMLAHWLFTEIHAQSDHQSKGVAFGQFGYIRDAVWTGHQINFAIVENKELVFFEPQTCRLVELSKSEFNSCTEARL